jgi:hypothetical protein
VAYSERARALRRCRHIYGAGHARAGEPCRAFALWDSPEGLCAAHGGRTRGPDRVERYGECATRPKCSCEAYAYPHRPGGGLCRWPDPPLYRDTTPAGYRPLGSYRRPRWIVTTWTGARRRVFDVTPPTVRRRSR